MSIEDLTIKGHSVVVKVTRFPEGTSADSRVTSLEVCIEPPIPEEEDAIDVDASIVVDMLIYALKLNYDAEQEGGFEYESPEHYAEDIARILQNQIETDDVSGPVQ